ncbi:MAG: transcription elongation factor GreA [Bacteroidales bacterium]|jgi:transcription elongation factor GreA|nr:transcription elongation factor GreA [Bacteroidales bacterium]MBR4366738.1 transcription elongation factor GreA [Bacteroidaceae bacterium]
MAYMSQEGYDKLKAEIKELEEVERPQVIRQIQEAREKGDLSENAEYDAAKEAQGKLESLIARKKMELANAKILDQSKIKTDVVQILSKVDIEDQITGKQFTYTLVSDSEVNLREGKISVNTPIAKGLIGKRVGDVADIITPVGLKKMKILNISVG